MYKKTPQFRVLFPTGKKPVGLLASGVFLLATALMFIGVQPAQAAAPANLNFQARLMTASGAIVPDGNYNVEFKLYNALSSSGSSQGSCTSDVNCLWTETRTGGNVVLVKNGYLTVNLGSVAAFGAVDFSQQLWLSMRVGGTGAPTWDSEMSPRLQLTATAYALKAGDSATLGGIGSSGFIQNQLASPLNSNIYIRSGGAASDPTVQIQLQGSQTGDLLQFRSAAGTLIGKVDSSANLAVNNFVDIAGTGPYLGFLAGATVLNTRTAGNTGLAIKGQSSQTGDLLQLQDNSGNPIAGFGGTGQLYLGRAGAATGSLKIYNSTNTNTVSIQSGGTGTGYTLTLPTALGSSGNCLTDTTGTGVLGFSSCATVSGATSVGALSNTSTANGGSITGGVLTLNVADGTNGGLLSAAANPQTIGGIKTFTGQNITNATVAGDFALQGKNSSATGLGIYAFTNNNTNTNDVLRLDGSGGTVFSVKSNGNITAAGTYNTNTFTGSALTFGAATPTSIQSAAGQGLTIDGGTTGSVIIGNGASGKTITIGSISAGTGIVERVGTGNYNLDGSSGATYTIGASALAGTINIGGVGAQTGAISIGAGTGAQALSFGAATTGAKAITIGGTGAASGSDAGTVINTQAGATNLKVANTGATVQTFTNSTAAFQIQDASGSGNLFVANTVNARVGIGTNAPAERLDIEGGNIRIGAQTNSTTAFSRVGGTTPGTLNTTTGATAIDNVYTSVVYNGSLYVGTAEPGKAEIYRYDGGTTWTRVSSATPGTINTGGTAAIDDVASMVVYNGYLYVGTYKTGGAEVYRYDGSTTWTKVSGAAGTISSTGSTAVAGAERMVVFNGSLYVSTDSAGGLAEVDRYDGGTTWTKVTPAGGIIAGSNAVDAITAMTVFNNALYVGTSDATGAGTGAEIYRYDGGSAGTSWTRVSSATAGTIATGGTASIYAVESLQVYNGALYAGTGYNATNAEVYRYEPATGSTASVWTKVSAAASGTFCGDSSSKAIASMVVYNGHLYAGSEASTGGASVCRYDGDLGANAVTTWTRVSNAQGTISSGSSATEEQIKSMTVYNGSLYVTAGTNTGTNLSKAEIHAYTSVDGQSYALNFNAAANNANAEQNGNLNLGSISFVGEIQNAAGGIGNNGTGSFLFSHGITTANGSYDLAEDYPTRDDSLTPGDLVAADPSEAGLVRKASGSAETVVGIYSEKPGLRLSQADPSIDGAKAIPVALAGRVPLKVTTASGNIQVGDYLAASSTPGVAVKATRAGPVVGRALAAYDSANPATVGKVMVLINLSWFDPSVMGALQQGSINDFGSLGTSLNSGQLSLATLMVSGDVSIAGSLKIAGTTTVSTLELTGHLITKGDAPTITLEPAAGSVDSETRHKAAVELVGNDTSGTLTLVAGDNPDADRLLKLTFHAKFDGLPRVLITPLGRDSSKLPVYIDEVHNDYFVVGTTAAPVAGQTYQYTYYVIQ